jgi:hypothetical protein
MGVIFNAFFGSSRPQAALEISYYDGKQLLPSWPQRMPTKEAEYTYAVVPCLPNQIACNEEESIYGLSEIRIVGVLVLYTSNPRLFAI